MAANNSPPSLPPHPRDVSAYFLGSRNNDEIFWKSFRSSAGFHAILVIFAIVSGLVFHKDPVRFTPSIRVDLVGLPDLKKKDLSNASSDDLAALDQKISKLKNKTAPISKVAPPEPNVMALKHKKEPVEKKEPTRKDVLKNALDRIKAISELESQVGKSKSKTQKIVAKGNSISQGNSLSGDVGTDTDAFVAKMRERLQDNWKIPIWLSNRNLSAKVVVFLDRTGYITNTVFAKGSGNQQFDDYVLKTIKMAQPFGIPPSEILDGGITLGFPL
jgi:hypothetical protein